MYMQCRHIKTNGLPCESPALKDGRFCYYHSKVHTIGAEPNLKYGPLQLSVPEDPASVQLCIARINDAIVTGSIDLKKATSLFHGLRIAAQFIDRKKFFHAAGTVQSAEQTSDGEELAPTNYVCDDDDECDDCPYNEICPRSANAKDED